MTVQPSADMVGKWRLEAEESGLHAHICNQTPRVLHPAVGNELRGLDLDSMRRSDLQDLARILDVSTSGLKDEIKARLAPLMASINATGTANLGHDYAPIPWVFTNDHVELVNTRCKNIVIPAKCPAFCSTTSGVLEDMSNCWRMSSRLQVFLMLPVLFLGTIPALYEALTKLALAITLLLGRVLSERTRRDKGYKTCFHHVYEDDVERAELLIPEGLSELEWTTPPSFSKSHSHHIVHYPRCVRLLGPLNGQWMFGDERRNKV